MVNDLTPFVTQFNVSAGELIQFAGALGLTNCPGAPQLTFSAGRPAATIAAEDGAVPVPQQSADTILDRMNDAGFSDAQTVWLLASHSIAHADNVDADLPHAPLDTTPFTFDSQFYLEVLLNGTGWPGVPNTVGEVESPLPSEGELRLQSDFAISQSSRTACDWQSVVNDQSRMVTLFAAV